MTRPTIAFLGTGIMGFPQARRLLEAGYQVSAWNRSRQKAAKLEPYGGIIADDPTSAVDQADIVIMMLADGPTSDLVLFDQGVAAAMKPNSLLINMASIPMETAQKEARRLAEMNIRYLDAPVSGGERGAIDGTLAIMVGGEQTDFDEAVPVLEIMGRPVLVGPAGAGDLAKLCNQLIVGNTITTVAEAVLLAQKGGVDPAKLCEALKGGFADSIILQQHGERMRTGNFIPGGRSVLQLKDTTTARDLARTLGLELPLLELVRELFRSHVEDHDGGETDHSGVYIELSRRNGIDIEVKQ